MIWIVKGDMSHQIISCNVHFEDGKYQLWVTRVNGKSLKLDENVKKEVVMELKEAIDFAIEHKEHALRSAVKANTFIHCGHLSKS